MTDYFVVRWQVQSTDGQWYEQGFPDLLSAREYVEQLRADELKWGKPAPDVTAEILQLRTVATVDSVRF